jgi:ribonuclease Z
MSTRDLIVLGTSSAVPTKDRNHNCYLLRWDGHGILFDPGEGTQRQLLHAGLSAHDITWICLTHFHGDHCLGVPGVIQRIARDGVEHPVRAVYPASGADYWRRLRHAAIFADTDVIAEQPIEGGEGEEVRIDATGAPFRLTARRLSHRPRRSAGAVGRETIESYGYRLAEPAGVTMVPDRLAAYGISGPLVGELRRTGRAVAPDGRTVGLAECSVPRPGQTAAFIMDTRECDAIGELADGVDLLVIEATFLDEHASLAADYGHLTAAQAGRIAAACGVRRLVLTHFSERYRPEDRPRFAEEAAAAYAGDIVIADDLCRVPVPRRRRARQGPAAGADAGADAGYRMVPHTADVALTAWAPGKYECVAQAVRALVGAFVEFAELDEPDELDKRAEAEPRGGVSVPVDRASDDDLLVSVLDEVIYQVEVHGRVPVDVTFDSSGDARFETVPLDAVRIVGAIPKAVSLHELRFGHVDGAWRCHVTVDV